MGIENRSSHGEEPRDLRAHYPSWGSKTAGGAEHREVAEGLITPHGDRKPAAPARPQQQQIVSSLPLMGIENHGVVTITGTGTGGSLPLMGIENRPCSTPSTQTSRSSLPLMGIENRPPDIATPAASSGLITPHGDRKRLIQIAVICRTLSLITPHGDRKPGHGAGGRQWNRRRSHYPSWGSKTRRPADPGRVDPPLITPHGDRKPGRAAGSDGGACRPHYPSWGSKTSAVPVGIEIPAPTSLPLMGIENQAECRTGRWSRPAHYPSWGSKTVEYRVLDHLAGEDLITPHGDRKLVGVANVHRPGLVLITPHGDRKPLFQRTAGLFVALCDRDRYLPRPGVVLFAAICAPEPRDSRGFLLRRRVVSDE